jgi:DNA polymerase-3 subunit beta
MKISVNKKELVSALKLALPDMRTLTSIGLKIEAKDGKITLSSTNIQCYVSTVIGGQILNEGVTAVHVADLKNSVSCLPGPDVILELFTAEELLVSSGELSLSLKTCDHLDMIGEDADIEVTIQSDDLNDALTMVSYACSKDQSREIMASVLLQVDTSTLTTVATDNHRLAIKNCDCKADSKKDLLIHSSSIKPLLKCLPKQNTEVIIISGENKALFSFNGVTFQTKLVHGCYPRYKHCIPDGYKNSITINRSQLIGILKAAKALKIESVILYIRKDCIKVSTLNASLPAEQEVGNEAEIDISVNPAFLLEAIELGVTDNVVIGFNNDRSPIGITQGEHIQVLMPTGK